MNEILALFHVSSLDHLVENGHVLLLLLQFLQFRPDLREGFWVACICFCVSQVLATLSLSKALKQSDISLVTALWKLGLIALACWGYLILGEKPSFLGLIGVGVSMIGVYFLNVNRAQISFWAPLAALYKDPGQRWAFLAAMACAPSVVFIKKMALLSSPMFAVFSGYLFCSILITPYAVYKSGKLFLRIGRHWKSFACLGGFAALSTWFGTTAYTLTVSSYAEAVKQVEVLLALLIGWFFFKERATIRRIWKGTAVMLIGLALLKMGG